LKHCWCGLKLSGSCTLSNTTLAVDNNSSIIAVPIYYYMYYMGIWMVLYLLSMHLGYNKLLFY
jgi:hypothetical protein